MTERLHNNIAAGSAGGRLAVRDSLELLAGRAELLVGRDRLLITMYLRNSNSFRQMARLAGVSESTITRRIRKIIKRLTDGRYITCLRHQHRLSRAELEVARYHFLCGLSLKKIAERLHCSVWTVRKTVKRLEQLTDVMEIQNKYKILTPKS